MAAPAHQEQTDLELPGDGSGGRSIAPPRRPRDLELPPSGATAAGSAESAAAAPRGAPVSTRSAQDSHVKTPRRSAAAVPPEAGPAGPPATPAPPAAVTPPASSPTRPLPAPRERSAESPVPFVLDPRTVALRAIASDLGAFGVPEAEREPMRAALTELAREVESGEVGWPSV